MDVKMPKLNGYEATIEIRKTNESIPIIALTAFTLVKENKKAFESGCTDIITKPVIKEILFNKLAKYV
jgi:CheY-like chemotaxis protein